MQLKRDYRNRNALGLPVEMEHDYTTVLSTIPHHYLKHQLVKPPSQSNFVDNRLMRQVQHPLRLFLGNQSTRLELWELTRFRQQQQCRQSRGQHLKN